MSIPNLNRKLLLEAPQRVPDGLGGYAETWQALGTFWAMVSARTGRETDQQSTPVSQVSVRITVRGVPFEVPGRPRPEQRFRDGPRVYLIKAVAEADPRGHYLVCYATEETVV